MRPIPRRLLKGCFLIFLIVATAIILRRHAQPLPYQSISGNVFHTQYHITYQHHDTLQQVIEQELQKLDQSLSAFNPQSTLSRINRNETTETDALVEHVFALAQKVSEHTDGAFDITVAPLVNAWGFGFGKSETIPSERIDSILPAVGYRKVKLENHRIIKQHPATLLDCSGIAKGLACDMVALLLEKHSIHNYMIEIGGEIRAHGQSPSHRAWSIGISTPKEDSVNTDFNDISSILQLTDGGLATSGNYRNFHISNGHKVAHTIDPRTGYPAWQSILSSSVIAPTCAEADAYATAFMVTGLDSARKILQKQPQLQAFFIYSDRDGILKIWHTAKWPIQRQNRT